MTQNITDKRIALAGRLMDEFCTGIGNIIGSNVTEAQVFEEVCEVLTIMVMAMPPEYRNSFLQAMSQIWTWEIEHNPNLRLAAMDVSKEFRQ
jgi:hypothetical protein